MEPSEDWPRTTSDDGVSWSTKSVKKNAKRASMAMYYGQAKTRQERGQGGPWLETVEATLSIDRALDALTGRVPGALKAKVYEGVREKIKGLKFTDGCRAAKGDCEAEAAARAELKAELRSLSEVRYQHRLAVEVGSLVAPGGPGSRTRGNRLFNPQATGGEPKRNE